MNKKEVLLKVHADALDYANKCSAIKREQDLSVAAQTLDAIVQYDLVKGNWPTLFLELRKLVDEATAHDSN